MTHGAARGRPGSRVVLLGATVVAVILLLTSGGVSGVSSAADGESATEGTGPTDTTPPSVTITTPPDGATYTQGDTVLADFACTDASQINFCTGPVADGAAIETATLGPHTFTVNGQDDFGNDAQATTNYTVVAGPNDLTDPTISIATPLSAASFDRNQVVASDFRCVDEVGGSGIDTCTFGAGGNVDGDPIPTSTLGPQSFVVTATDLAGNEATMTRIYNVVARPMCRGMAVTVDLGLNEVPTTGADVIQGTAGPDVAAALSGDDRFCGLGGNDNVDLGPGVDIGDGGPGTDTIRGGTEGDTLVGGTGNDALYGGSGSDRLFGGVGSDRLSGQSDDDVLSGATGNDQLVGGPGVDNLTGATGADRLFGNSGADRLSGGGQGDLLRGDPGEDLVRGGSGNDTVDGGSDNDRLYGETGSDRLLGGAGNDRCDGGSSNDQSQGCEIKVRIP